MTFVYVMMFHTHTHTAEWERLLCEARVETHQPVGLIIGSGSDGQDLGGAVEAQRRGRCHQVHDGLQRPGLQRVQTVLLRVDVHHAALRPANQAEAPYDWSRTHTSHAHNLQVQVSFCFWGVCHRQVFLNNSYFVLNDFWKVKWLKTNTPSAV